LVVECIYDGVHRFSEGLVAVLFTGKVGFVDTTGKEKIPIIYDYPSGEE